MFRKVSDGDNNQLMQVGKSNIKFRLHPLIYTLLGSILTQHLVKRSSRSLTPAKIKRQFKLPRKKSIRLTGGADEPRSDQAK